MSHRRLPGAPARRAVAIRRFAGTLAAAAGIVLLSQGPAYASLDTGAGTVLLQLLLGAAAGLAMAARLYWGRIKALLGIRPKPDRVRVEPE